MQQDLYQRTLEHEQTVLVLAVHEGGAYRSEMQQTGNNKWMQQPLLCAGKANLMLRWRQP